MYIHTIVIVTLLGIYILCAGPFLTIHLFLPKSDLCLSLHTGRPESAEASHFDGGSCAQLRLFHVPQYQSTRIRTLLFKS